MPREPPGDEVLALGGDGRLGGESHAVRFEHDLIAQNLLLAAALPEGPAPEQHLVQHHAHRPHIHLRIPAHTLVTLLVLILKAGRPKQQCSSSIP